jgi:PKD repeat protein
VPTPNPVAPLKRLAPALTLLFLLAACGGGGGTSEATPPSPPPPPPPAVNQAPSARFDAPAGAVAGQPVVFDGRSSSDPEGSALRFSWNFGDGSAGGTAQIAHLYPAAGTYMARLQVTDAQGAAAEITRSVTVTAAPAALRTVSMAGRVTGIDGQPLAGVSITVQGASGAGSSATTDAEGRATLNAGVGVDVVLRLAKAGYTEQVKRLKLPGTVGSDGSFEASLMPRAAAVTLPDATAGGTLSGVDGASLLLPTAALVDAATGAAVTGAVQVTMTPVDVNAAAVAAFPGRFEGLNGDGMATPIVSFGTTEFLLSQGGRPLQIKPGARATIELPVYASQDLGGAALAIGGSLPLWALDERSGQWINEGTGTLVASSASPTGLALRAEVGHFSWWNADKGYTPYRPRPRCINDVPGQYDSIFEQATICKMLAEMDKPIPAQGGAASGRARAAAVAASAPRFPFPAVRIDGDLPMAGGVPIDIPPDYDVLLTGTALNGTWRGQLKVKGGQGMTGEVNVPLRPVAAGGSSELITLPFDQARTAAMFRIDTYRFVASAGQGVDLSVAAEGSSVTGRVRLRSADGLVLDAADFGAGSARLQVALATAGEYRIEIEPRSGAPGGYRLQAAFATLPARLPSAIVSEGALSSTPVVVTQAGTALALWVGGEQQLMGSRNAAAGQDWSGAQALAAAPGYNDNLGLQAVVDGTGQAWVLWNDGNGPVVARGALATGAAWAAPTPLASNTCRGSLAQRLAVNASGQAVVMWQRTGAVTGWCSRRFESGAWTGEQVIGTTPLAAGASPGLVLTAAGQSVAVWQLDAFGGLALAQQDAAAAAWSAPTVVVSDAFAGAPMLAAEGSNLALAWVGNGAVFAAHRPSGQPWSASQRLGDAGTSANPQLSALGGGRFVVAWNTFSSGPRVVEHAAGTGWGAPQALAQGPALPIMLTLAGAGDGSAVTVSLANNRAGSGLELVIDRRDPATGSWVTSPMQLAAKVISAGNARLPRTAPVAVDAAWAGAVWLELSAGSNPTLRVRASRLAAAP